MPKYALRLVLAALGGALALALVLIAVSSERGAATSKVWSQIEPDGTARFFIVSDDTRLPGWTVNCRVAMRGCVARSAGLVLRLGETREPWLIAATSPDAHFFAEAQGVRVALPGVFTRSLPPKTVSILSKDDAYLVVREHGQPDWRAPTAGLRRVIDYLGWLETNSARAMRDARLWPGRDPATDTSREGGTDGPESGLPGVQTH